MNIENRTNKTQSFVNYFFALVSQWNRKLLGAVLLMTIMTVSIDPVPGNVYGAPNLQASTLTFVTEADARVQQSSPGTNYGTASYLQVDGANNSDVESFIRFTVNGVTGAIQNARLRVYVTTNGSANGPAAYSANNSWTETAINWNNRPARTSGVLDNKGATSKNSWVEYNVTAAVTGNGTYTFVLVADSDDAVRLSSREGSRVPELVITFGAAGSTATQPPAATVTNTRTATQPPAASPTATRTGTQAPAPTTTRTFTPLPSSSQTNTATPSRTRTPTTGPTATSSPGIGGQVIILNPIADSYVESGNPSANFGSQTQLRGDGSPEVRSYLRFNVNGLNGAVSNATLRMFANSTSSGGYEIRGVSNNTWDESTITYSNAPAVGATLGTTGGFSGGTWTSVDVTSYITGNGAYNLALTVPGSTAISFASREVGNNAPQLVIETQGAPLVTATATRTPTGPAVNTATATRTATRTPASNPTATTSGGSVVLVGAGDISNCSRTQDTQTAQLLDTIPGTVFTAGDNAYVDGTYTEYLNCYEPTWGRHKSRTKPSPGNHEYLTSGAAGYFQYFNNVPSYYAYDLGAWRIYSLNSEIDVSLSSPQVTWLANDLAANPRQCVAAYWHKPRWSSGSNHGVNNAMQNIWQILYDAGAELVINGHEHHYERFSEMNGSGAAVSQGLREIVAGTGGASLYPFGTPLAASQVRNNNSYGVLKLTLRANGYDWQFVPIPGSTLNDSGSDTCH